MSAKQKRIAGTVAIILGTLFVLNKVAIAKPVKDFVS
jgi:hypothetical protein